MEYMTVGDSRHVEVPVNIAEGARKWLPDPDSQKTLCIEMRLASLEPAK